VRLILVLLYIRLILYFLLLYLYYLGILLILVLSTPLLLVTLKALSKLT